VDEDQADPDEEAEAHGQEEETLERRISLNEERLGAVVAALKACEARRVLDLGCGEGRLLKALLADKDVATCCCKPVEGKEAKKTS